jgi:amino acid permease
VVIGYRSVERNVATPARLDSLSMNGSFSDALVAFPIISIAYLCHFNVLPMNCELQKPTRERIKYCLTSLSLLSIVFSNCELDVFVCNRSVLHVTMSVCTVMYVIIGLLGYSYAIGDTLGNVLLNFPTTDIVITLGMRYAVHDDPP